MSDETELGNLPALKGLGKLSDMRPIAVIDSREQDALCFLRLPSVRDNLKSGDYSYRGGEEVFACERKSIPDLVACCVNSNRDRFSWELHRLRGYDFRRLVIVGDRDAIARGEYRSQLNPKVVFSTLSAFEARYGIPFAFFSTPAEAAAEIERWIWWHARETVERANTLLRGSQNSALDTQAKPGIANPTQ